LPDANSHANHYMHLHLGQLCEHTRLTQESSWFDLYIQ
jgi:hypothetical protein